LTLIYLTVETRQNTDALLATSRQAILDAEMAFMADVRENANLFIRRDDPDLSPEERFQLGYFRLQFLRMREFAWFQYQNGILDEATWESYIGTARVMLSSEQARSILATPGRLDPEFAAYMRDRLDIPVETQ
jgi:hypothetical protein